MQSLNLLSFLAQQSPGIDLQRFLVPTTAKLINAIPQVEPMILERTHSPAVLELATTSLDFILFPDAPPGKKTNLS